MGKIFALVAAAACMVCMCLGVMTGCTQGAELGTPGTNPDKVFRVVGSWEKTGIGSHYNSGTNIGPVQYFAIEGLYQYVRDLPDACREYARPQRRRQHHDGHDP